MLRLKGQGVGHCFDILQPITAKQLKVKRGKHESTIMEDDLAHPLNFTTFPLVLSNINLKCYKFYTELATGNMIPLDKLESQLPVTPITCCCMSIHPFWMALMPAVRKK